MDFTSAIFVLLSILLLISCFYLLLWPKNVIYKPKLYLAPEADGARPFIGHLHLMGGGSSGKLPHIALADVADKHGPIFTIRLGVHKALIVSSWELAKELFTTCDVAISSRPKLRSTKHFGYDFAMFGFSPYGTYWRELRKLISVELLSSQRIELLKNVRVAETRQAVSELYKLWETKKKDGNGSRLSIEMKKWFGELNMNVVLGMVVGKRYFGEGVNNAEEARRCREVMRDFFYLSGVFVAADALPFLGWLDLGGYEKEMKRTAKELDLLAEKWLEEHKKKDYSNGAAGKPQDFMGVMLSAMKDANVLLSHYDSDTIIKSTCASLISGGIDTSSVMLIWALSLVLNNPHVKTKVQEELDTQIGKQRRVEESDLNNLVYLHAVVKETLRLYPAGPLGGLREFTQDCEVGGYHVPKGTWLMINLWKMHRDPRIWSGYPLEFRPERFLDSHNNMDVKGQHFELLPFGSGRRICPGIHLGLQMLLLVLANLLHGFDISTPSNEMVDMTESAGLTNIKAKPLDVLLVPRLSSNLYY